MPDETYTKPALDSTSATTSGSHKIGFPAVAGIAGGIATKVYNAIVDLKSQIDGKADTARGLPTGGATDEVLKKVNATNYNVTWGAPSAVANSSTTVKGISKSSTTPTDSANPVHVEDTDGRLPTQGENDALVGTSGTPSSTNRYATSADPKLSAYFKWFHSGSTASVVTGKGWERVLQARTLQEIGVEFDVAPTVSTTVAILRRASGGAASQIATVTIAANSKVGSTTGLSVALSAGDGMRVDVTAGGTTGSDMFVVARAL